MKTKDVVLEAACTFLIIIGAYIAVPIGPVPFVLTNFMIMLIGLLFGWKKAVIATVIYLVLGAVGLPVFSNGKAGFAHIIGLTGGFLISFIPLAFISGLAQNRSPLLKAVFLIAGSLVVYSIGVPWALWVSKNIIAPETGKAAWDLATALKYCVYPFLIPNVFKIAAAVGLSLVLKPVLKPFISKEDE